MLISLKEAVPLIYDSPFSKPLSWEIAEDQVWTVIGNNGAGKSSLMDVLMGKYNMKSGEISYNLSLKNKDDRPSKHIKAISFNSVYAVANFRDTYYQQRFNHTETDFSPKVSDLFSLNDFDGNEIVTQLLQPLMDKYVVQLSSGELRKVLIARVLTEKPQVLIFDNPFIGLDIASRELMENLLPKLIQDGIHLIFAVSSFADIPRCTTHLLKMGKGYIENQEEYQIRYDEFMPMNSVKIDWSRFPVATTECDVVAQMRDLTISYGSRVVNSHINWTVRAGEKWALLGPNGSGKSTLLSYVFADNPQAYSKDITLFDRKRGTGESIWDIKKRIGYTSSEMHLYYRENVDCLSVVKSGFFDSIGLFRKCTEEQSATAEYVMNLLRLNHLRSRLFLRTSAGEQRMVLFARAVVKNPELLVLDEPFHGLDDVNKRLCSDFIEQFIEQRKKTLVFVTHCMEEIPANVNNIMKLG
jgi:molybdate transport system ATP-binding protein